MHRQRPAYAALEGGAVADHRSGTDCFAGRRPSSSRTGLEQHVCDRRRNVPCRRPPLNWRTGGMKCTRAGERLPDQYKRQKDCVSIHAHRASASALAGRAAQGSRSRPRSSATRWAATALVATRVLPWRRACCARAGRAGCANLRKAWDVRIRSHDHTCCCAHVISARVPCTHAAALPGPRLLFATSVQAALRTHKVVVKVQVTLKQHQQSVPPTLHLAFGSSART